MRLITTRVTVTKQTVNELSNNFCKTLNNAKRTEINIPFNLTHK